MELTIQRAAAEPNMAVVSIVCREPGCSVLRESSRNEGPARSDWNWKGRPELPRERRAGIAADPQTPVAGIVCSDVDAAVARKFSGLKSPPGGRTDRRPLIEGKG